MNGPFWHLLINHIPVVGLPFVLVLLLLAWSWKSEDLAKVAYGGLVVIALATFLSDQTGDSAAEVASSIPTISAEAIPPHEQAAGQAVISTIILGVLGIAGLVFFRQSRRWIVICTVGAFLVSLQLARVAHLGGLIRHPEVQFTRTP